ncbi:obscurin-like protein 1a isoform X2 [Narcine bancroftii]|uniref:obscurin-like protein 1a isoform X2 n=1 Tax=Narcine bancroftii TaxID=1343680 RepID=UPI0038314114
MPLFTGIMQNPGECPHSRRGLGPMDVFGGAPRFLAYPRALTVACGANAILECRIAGDPRPAVVWERDATPILPSAHHRFLEEGVAYRLVVMKAGAEDSGQYICKAKNRVGETYAAATLTVADGGPGDQPAFLVRPSSARVSRGDDVVFTGRLSGCPQPLVTWEKDGKNLGEIFESTHFSAGTEGEGWHHLKIFGARPPDGGVYICRARSALGEATAAAMLLVEPGPATQENGEPGPEWQHGERRRQKCRRGPQEPVSGGKGGLPGLAKVKVFSVWQGKHAKFRCLVTGKPTPEIVWQKGGCVVVPDRRHLLYQDREGYFNLKLLYCKQGDGGLYTCAASNTAGHTLSSVLLHIKEPPTKFRSQLQDIEVREREQAILECEVPAESMPAAWYLEDRRLQPSAKYVIEQQGSLRRLTIKDITMDDDGVYLCQMKDGGRSIAEVAVKGKIVKRLPRKLDVLEGENTAFCVDLDEDNVEVRWYKDGEPLSESHKTIIKSFGKTHILVFVNVSAEDAGVITFAISDSKSSSQLRVKPRRRAAPGAPENARMSCERPNAASLAWDPPPDCGSTGAAGYVVERQEVGAEEWVQCLTTRTGSAVEILGDSVPAEGRYRFRICSINEYGRGGQAEFPGAVHLVPAAKILTHLNDATVCQDGDAEFTIELSAVVIGTWHMMGKQIQEDERFRVQQSRTQHFLRIRQVRLQENEAEITFVAHGVRDSAILFVKAAPLRISLSPGTERELCVAASESIVLSCEVSSADAPISWCKDGQEIESSDRMTLQSCGQLRQLVIHSSLPSDSGQYTCDAIDDAMTFCVTVTDPPVRIVNTADDSKAAYLKSDRIVLSCELSRPNAEVKWYKDGLEVEGSANIAMVSHGVHRSLIVQSAGTEDSGEYVCDAGDDSIFYDISVREPQATLEPTEGGVRTKYLCAETVVLSCEVSLSDAEVTWYKDGGELQEMPGMKMEAEGVHRRLVIPHCSKSDSGVYVCETTGDSLTFTITVTEPPVSIVSHSPSELTVMTGAEFVLWCEVSRPGTEVKWRRDGVGLEPNDRCRMEVEGERRRLRVCSATVEDRGTYVCDTADDAAEFKVTVSEPPVSIVNCSPSELTVVTGAEFVLWCEVSWPGAEVRWRRDEVGLEPSDRCRMEIEGDRRRLRVHSAMVEDGGTYVCDAADDAAEFKVTVSEPPVSIVSCSPSELTAVTGAEFVLWCEVLRPGAEVRWRRDGVGLEPSDRCRMEVEGKRRSLRVHSATVEDGGMYVCDAADDAADFKVTVSEPPVRITWPKHKLLDHKCWAAEDILLECEVSRVDGQAKWYKDGERMAEGARVSTGSEGVVRSLRILGAQAEDAGEYLCDIQSDSIVFRVTVEEPAVRIVGSDKVSEERCFTESEAIAMTCELSRPDVAVRWYRDGTELRDSGRIRIDARGLTRELMIFDSEPQDSGQYVCDAGTDRLTFNVTVAEAPVLFKNKGKLLEDVTVNENGKAVLSAIVSKEKACVTWLRHREPVCEGEKYEARHESRVHSLIVKNVQKEDSGFYTCRSADDEMIFNVNVADLPLLFVLRLEDLCVQRDGTVTLWCELNKVKGDVVWLKDGREVEPSSRQAIRAEGRLRSLTLTKVTLKDQGEYACESKDDRTAAWVSVVAPRVVEFISDLHNMTVLEGDEATFKCMVSPEDARVVWKVNDSEVPPGSGQYVASQNGLCHTLLIRGCQAGELTRVTAEAEGIMSNANLQVQARRIRLRKSLVDMETVEGEAATFQVELSHPDVEGVWIKDGIRIKPGPSKRISVGGSFHSLTLSALTLEDTGTITFQSDSIRCSARLTVREPPVTFLKQLKDLQVPETTFVSLEVELSRSNVEVRWYKNNLEMKPNNGIRIYSMGRKRIAQLGRCGMEDSGIYTCDAGADKTSAKLEVHEREIRIVKELEDLDICENDNAIFACEVSHEGVKGEWLKNGEKIKANNSIKMRQEGTKHFLLIYKVRAEDAGEIRFMAKTAESVANLDVNELPIKIIKPLRDKTALEKHKVILECKVSKPRARVRWYRAGEELWPTDKYEICSEDCYRKLVIHDVSFEDEDTYTCDAFDDTSSAKVLVEEQAILMVKSLEDVEVTAPETALLECEVSVPVIRAPQWSLNGQVLQNGKGVRVENNGTIQRLILSETSPKMTGLVKFTAGKARSSAHLTVKAD